MAKKNTELLLLKKELKEEKLRSVYLLFGDEGYLRDDYEKRIAALVPDAGFPEFNRFVFEGPDTPLSDYDDALESFPMMTDKKLIIIRDSRIFKKANEEVKEFWLKRLKEAADDTVIVFNEADADGRGVLYKAAKKAGMAVKFDYQSDADLVTWVNRQALKARLKMSKDTAQYLVAVADPGLGNLTNEFGKLTAYCEGSITKDDIDKVVSKAMTVVIFDLTDALTARDADKTMKVLSELRGSNQSGFGVLYLIYSNIKNILKMKLCGAKSKYDAAKLTGMSPYIAGKYFYSAQSFSEKELERMLIRIPEIDSEIKSGRAQEWPAVEQFVAECLHSRQ